MRSRSERQTMIVNHEQAVEELKRCQANGDTEGAHSDADRVLCELLTALGFEAVVAEWSKVDKWYA